MEFTNFEALPGYVLILPFEKDKKATDFTVVDSVDKSYKGQVIKVGPNKVTEANALLECPVKEGDYVLYSIAGCEETKLTWKKNPRQRFVIAPFGRLLLKLS